MKVEYEVSSILEAHQEFTIKSTYKSKPRVLAMGPDILFY